MFKTAIYIFCFYQKATYIIKSEGNDPEIIFSYESSNKEKISMSSQNLNNNKPTAKTTKLPTPLCKAFFRQSVVSSKVCCPYCQ